MTDFLNRLKENSQEIDKFLDAHLPFGNGLSKKLFESMRYSSISGGKKIRAFLVLETKISDTQCVIGISDSDVTPPPNVSFLFG